MSSGVLPPPLRGLSGHSGAVNAIRFTSDGNYCISCSDDRSVKLWNPHRDDPSQHSNALLIKSYSGVHGYQILDVAVTTDNAKFVSGGGDKTAFLWDVSSGRVIRRFQSHSQRINTVHMNVDGTLLFTGSYDKQLHIWDLRSHNREPLQVLTDFKDSVTCVQHTRTQILASSVDGYVRTYDLRIGQMHSDSVCSEGVVYVKPSYDMNCALSTCLGGTLKLTEIRSGRLLQSYTGHVHSVYKTEAHFTSDDGRVLAGSEDGKVHCWDLVKGSLLTTFKAHNRAISSIAYHPTLACFLSASYDGSIKFWNDTGRTDSQNSTT
mmetsp:Transcript_12170/g.18379  ORF Transcript_12170/g.18379 Transcript_12170/m.18379 type:complete len:320 (-) Transcript_12170:135-1094(-)